MNKILDELENQNREILVLMSATLWVLEHPDVNKIKFCGNPADLAKRIRIHLEKIKTTYRQTSNETTK